MSKKEQESVSSRTIKVICEVELSDDQKIAIGHTLVDQMAERDKREEDFKVMRSFHKSEIEKLDGRIMELRAEINTGRGNREVEAEEFYFWDLGKVKVQRTDTDEVVSERPLYNAEKRMRLPLDEIPMEDREDQMTLVKLTPPHAEPEKAAGPRRVLDPLAVEDDFEVLGADGRPE